MTDLRITSYPRWQTADVHALTDRALAWLRTFTILHVPDERRLITVSADAVPEYIQGAREAGLEVEA